jgi:hypothetical protein
MAESNGHSGAEVIDLLGDPSSAALVGCVTLVRPGLRMSLGVCGWQSEMLLRALGWEPTDQTMCYATVLTFNLLSVRSDYVDGTEVYAVRWTMLFRPA